MRDPKSSESRISQYISWISQDIPEIPRLTGMVKDPKSSESWISQDIPGIPRLAGMMRDPKSLESQISLDIPRILRLIVMMRDPDPSLWSPGFLLTSLGFSGWMVWWEIPNPQSPALISQDIPGIPRPTGMVRDPKSSKSPIFLRHPWDSQDVHKLN